jgi:hypothetical protein
MMCAAGDVMVGSVDNFVWPFQASNLEKSLHLVNFSSDESTREPRQAKSREQH